MNPSRHHPWSALTIMLLFLTGVGSGMAQEARVRATLATNGTLWAGQKATLVVELLAPGYFASAPAFDLPDPPGLLLLPSTDHPIMSSRQIDGISYTVQRHELSVFAAQAGGQTIPPLTVRFAFRRTPFDTNEVLAEVKTGPVRFTVVAPPGTQNLGEVISARDLKVEETWQPEPGKPGVRAGDAFTRTITFTAPEVPGMLFPPFPAGTIDGLGIYVKPEVLDQTDRGELSGERRDTITYVCQRAGRFTIPAARLVWWDLDAGQLRTNDFAARTFEVTPNLALSLAGPAAGTTGAGIFQRPGARRLTGLVLVVLVILVLGNQAGLRRALAGVFAGILAEVRPVHLQPLNPPDRTNRERL